MDMANVSFGFAFLAGLASFFSPCVFALVPAYIGYLGGRSVAQSTQDDKPNTWLTFSHGIAFVFGFSLVFISLGLTASIIGDFLYNARPWLARIGGVVVIIFGVHMTGLFRIPFLEYDLRKQDAPDRGRGYLASFLMGVFFSAGWAPCTGPILGLILGMALYGGDLAQGISLLAVYSAGLAIPFLIASVQIGLVTTVLRRYGKVMHYVEISMGVVMIILGILLVTGRYEQIATYMSTLPIVEDELALGRWLLIGLVSLLLLAFIPAYVAHKKGRNFWNWWFFGVGLFPVALPAAFIIKPQLPEMEGAD